MARAVIRVRACSQDCVIAAQRRRSWIDAIAKLAYGLWASVVLERWSMGLHHDFESEQTGDGAEARARQLQQLLLSFGFTKAQLSETLDAFGESVGGVERCAYRAQSLGKRHGNSGAGLLLKMIRAGEHLIEPDPTVRIKTGWRRVRGSHGDSYVEDPQGTDPLPPSYDFTPSPYQRDDWGADVPTDDDDGSLEAAIEREMNRGLDF